VSVSEGAAAAILVTSTSFPLSTFYVFWMRSTRMWKLSWSRAATEATPPALQVV